MVLMMEHIRRRDILLAHPIEGFSANLVTWLQVPDLLQITQCLQVIKLYNIFLIVNLFKQNSYN